MSGVYIHIPFCRQACIYCDFHFSTKQDYRLDMVHAIAGEAGLRKNYLQGVPASSVYFGGGTPSLLSSDEIQLILEAVRKNFGIEKDAEITLEANPDDLTAEKLAELRFAGINRLSIGIQSFHDEHLRMMNRAHDSVQALRSVPLAREAGFENITVDLMYGLPGMTEKQWTENLEQVFSMDVPHLSCYSLTVEPRTTLATLISRKKISPPEEDDAVAHFGILMEMTAAAGYEHYEISNFAKYGKYSRHNTSYWKQQPYAGLGPSAHSFDVKSRQWNIYNNHRYMRSLSEGVVPAEREELTKKDKFNEYILTSLRTMWGLKMSVVADQFGNQVSALLENKLTALQEKQLVEKSGDSFVLSAKGKFFCDRISLDLFI